MRFLLISAAIQPGCDFPYLVKDPADPRQFIGVKDDGCDNPPKGNRRHCGCAHRAEHFAPTEVLVAEHPELTKLVAAGVLVLHFACDAADTAAARRALRFERAVESEQQLAEAEAQRLRATMSTSAPEES